MNRILLSCVAIITNSFLILTQSESDNLKAALSHASTDSSKVSLYLALYEALAEVDTAQSSDYLRQAVALSERKPGESFSCQTYLKLCKYYRKQGKVREALLALRRVDNACTKIKAIDAAVYAERGILNQLEGEYDSAVNYFLKALAIDESMGNSEKSANRLGR